MSSKLIRLAFIFSLALIFLGGQRSAFAQVWQWSTEVTGGTNKAGTPRAFLWIPPDCEKVKAVVFSQNNMEELSILEHVKFREEMGALGFAEIWVSPSFSHVFNFKKGAGTIFNATMKKLAEISGYEGLSYAPIVYIGHSAAASAPYYFAAWNPKRTLAAISVSGQWPYFRHEIFAPDIWGDKNIDYIPCLETMGEYEAANTWSKEGLKERQEHPLLPLSMLACPAEGHFATSDEKVEYIAFYIKKAAQYRLPKDYPENGPPKLVPIDPTKTGWLADKWRLNQQSTAPAAPIGEYDGDPAQAFWFFDEEHVRHTEAYQSKYRNKKAQLIGYVEDGEIVPQRNTHQQIDLSFLPGKDGMTFQLEGVFMDTVPEGSPRPATWTGLPAGSPVGNAGNEGLISIEKVTGPFQKVGANTFAIRMERGMGADLNVFQLWFVAKHPGNEVYKPAVQQAKMDIPARNKKGRSQKIIFPQIPDQHIGVRSIKLEAKTNSKLPVRYYVLEGPAEVNGDKLKITKIPPRTKFPVKVSVVAWQWGRGIEPFYQSAEPVFNTFYINRKKHEMNRSFYSKQSPIGDE